MSAPSNGKAGNGNGAVVFRSKNRTLVTAAVETLKAEHPMTLRQLYYRLVSAGAIQNKQAEYQRLGSVMTRLREAGDVPRSWIVDHIRTRLKPSSWSGLADFADSVRECCRRDFWASLAVHVEVFPEKDAVAGTIQPVTEKYDIGLQVCRGYASVSFAGEIADQWARIEKPIYAYYVGDFDPSGFDIERDLREKLERYSGREIWTEEEHPRYVEEILDLGCDLSRAVWWKRLGVIEQDFDAYDLVRLPLKRDKNGKYSDKRTAGFIEEHGYDCAEIDAIPPSELRRRVEQAILSHIDQERWARLQEIEAAEQDTLNTYVESLAAEKVNLD
jgi:hypothetical protein